MFQRLGGMQQATSNISPSILISVTPNTFDSSSTIVVMCHADKDKITAVPCRFEWTRIWQGQRQPIAHCKGNAYVCSPLDIGATIDVLITSLEDQFPGCKQLSFGPIQIDNMLKRSIEKIVTLDRGTFPVSFTCNHTKITNVPCTLTITQEAIKIKDERENYYYKFHYLPGQPTMSIQSTDPTKIELTVAQATQANFIYFLKCLTGNDISSTDYNKFSLHFVNRISRDTFMIALQVFSTKRALIASQIIKTMEKKTIQVQDFDYVMQIDSLKRYVKQQEVEREKLQHQINFYKDEIKRLQEEMENVRFTFSSLIQKNCKLEADLADISYIAILKEEEEPEIRTVINQIQSKEARPSADPSLDMDRSKLTMRKQAAAIRSPDQTAFGQQTINKNTVNYQRKIEQLQVQLQAEQKTIMDLNQLVGYYSKLTLNLNDLESSNNRLRSQNHLLHLELQKLKRKLNSDEEVNKWKKRYESLQDEVKILRRGNEQLSKSRILSLELEEAVQQDYSLLKEQCHMLTEENKRLAQTCSRYVPIIQEASELKQELARLQSITKS